MTAELYSELKYGGCSQISDYYVPLTSGTKTHTHKINITLPHILKEHVKKLTKKTEYFKKTLFSAFVHQDMFGGL